MPVQVAYQHFVVVIDSLCFFTLAQIKRWNVERTFTPVCPRTHRYTFEERADVATNAAGKNLLTLMATKKTNLCVAADVTTSAEVLALAACVGPHICCLKTHCDVVHDWTAATAASLRALAETHNFLIFEDRKFADIGNTVAQQCAGGHYRIAEWADMVNAHSLPGPGETPDVVGGWGGEGSMVCTCMWRTQVAFCCRIVVVDEIVCAYTSGYRSLVWFTDHVSRKSSAMCVCACMR